MVTRETPEDLSEKELARRVAAILDHRIELMEMVAHALPQAILEAHIVRLRGRMPALDTIEARATGAIVEHHEILCPEVEVHRLNFDSGTSIEVNFDGEPIDDDARQLLDLRTTFHGPYRGDLLYEVALQWAIYHRAEAGYFRVPMHAAAE